MHLMSHPLLDYVLSAALEHFEYCGSRIGSVLYDIKVLEQDIDRHSRVWDTEYLGFPGISWGYHRWPRHTHDLTLYILIAFAPDLLLRAYLPRPALKPKKDTNPLVYAAYFNKHEQARTLLSRGAKLNCRGLGRGLGLHSDSECDWYTLPIEVAMECGHYSMVTFFVAEGSIVSPEIFDYLSSWPMPSFFTMLLQTDDFVEAVNGPENNPVEDDLRWKLCDELLFNVEMGGVHLIHVVRRMIQVSLDYFRSDMCGNEPFRFPPNTSQSRNILAPFSIL